MRSGPLPIPPAQPSPLRVRLSPRFAPRSLARGLMQQLRRALTCRAILCCRAPQAAEPVPSRHSRPRRGGALQSFCQARWRNLLARQEHQRSWRCKRGQLVRSRPSHCRAKQRSRLNLGHSRHHALRPRPWQPRSLPAYRSRSKSSPWPVMTPHSPRQRRRCQGTRKRWRSHPTGHPKAASRRQTPQVSPKRATRRMQRRPWCRHPRLSKSGRRRRMTNRRARAPAPMRACR